MASIKVGNQNQRYAIVSNDTDDETEDRIIDLKPSHITKQHALISLLKRPLFVLFTICLILSILLIIYWFINEELVFMVCGITASFMAIVGMYKFRKVLSYKDELQLTLNSNRKLKIEIIKLKKHNDRSFEATKILRNAKERVKKINRQNRNNFNSFKRIRRKIEHNENITDDIYHDISNVNQLWRNQNIDNEKETLQKVFNRFIRDVIHNKDCHIISSRQVDEFERMLPTAMRAKFSKSAVMNGKQLIKDKQFEEYLNEFATFDFDTMIRKKTKSKSEKAKSKHIAFKSTVEISRYTPSPTYAQNDEVKMFAAMDSIQENVNDENVNNNQLSPVPPSSIHVAEEPDDVDIKDDHEYSDNMEEQKKQRQIGKINTKEWETKQGQNTSGKRNTPRRIIKRDSSWVKHKGKKSVHPVHESIDEMAINKLVSQAEITKKLSPELDAIGTDDIPETEEQETRKRSSSKKVINPDDSWVKHQPAKPIHPVHESVDALELEKMVSGAAIHQMLQPVGEDMEEDAYDYPPDD